MIEDDASDAQLLKAAVADSGAPIEIHWARGLEQASELLAPTSAAARRGRPRGTDFSCVLLDLAAPADLPHPPTPRTAWRACTNCSAARRTPPSWCSPTPPERSWAPPPWPPEPRTS
ncbi:hypothetical protein ACFQ0M_22735 [Kitasatospora aburaviensis]